jgi:hypothetical protein
MPRTAWNPGSPHKCAGSCGATRHPFAARYGHVAAVVGISFLDSPPGFAQGLEAGSQATHCDGQAPDHFPACSSYARCGRNSDLAHNVSSESHLGPVLKRLHSSLEFWSRHTTAHCGKSHDCCNSA